MATATQDVIVSAPLPTITEVRNGATNQPGPIAPGLIIVIYGSALGSDPQTNFILNGDIYATRVANTRVLIGGYTAAIIYASSTQVSAIVPYDIAGKTSTFVQVEYQGQRSNAETVQVLNTAPGVFTQDLSGQGPAVALNQDGSMNSPSNPEAVGRTITVMATGEGQTIPPGINGKLADEAVLPQPVAPVSATISGIPAIVQSYGAVAGDVAGKFQAVVVIPPGATSGDVILHIGANDSQAGATVSIQ